MNIYDLLYPVLVIDKQPGGTFSVKRDEAQLHISNPFTVHRRHLQRSNIVDISGREFDILAVSFQEPRNVARRVLDVLLDPPVQIELALSEPRTTTVEEFSNRIRRAFDELTFREVYEDADFDVNAFDEFRSTAVSVRAIIEYIIGYHSSG